MNKDGKMFKIIHLKHSYLINYAWKYILRNAVNIVVFMNRFINYEKMKNGLKNLWEN